MKLPTLLAILLTAGCATSPAAVPRADGSGAASIASAESDQEWVERTLASMSVRDKAAQLVWPQIFGDFRGGDDPIWQRQLEWVTRDRVGGFIMSIGSPLEIAAKLNALQRASGVPLLVGADLEYGAGYRARGGYFTPNAIDLGGATVLPAQMAVGATRDTMLAYEMGRVTAVEGRALGIHLAFTPVLDVNNNPANPVINTRAFAEDAELVANMGVAMIRGIQDHGMIATAKHFPGHGDTEINSHLAMSVVPAPRERLEAVELRPFRAAIQAGVGSVMSFHGQLPALDPRPVPATLSRAVMTDLLRRDMGFEGLLISDALDMRGVLGDMGLAEATQRAVEAGIDVLLMPPDVGVTIQAVVDGVSTGRYDETRLDASVRRILAMKRRLRLDAGAVVDLDSARAVVGTGANASVGNDIAARSITLVKDVGDQIPLRRASGSRVLSITVAARADLGAGLAFDAELRRAIPGTRSLLVSADNPTPLIAGVVDAARQADVVVISSYQSHGWAATSVAAPRAIVDMVQQLHAAGKRPIFVALGTPYLLAQFPDVPTYLVAWSGFPSAQRAAARAMLGEAAIGGRLPITIPGVASFGTGLSRSTSHAR